MYIPLDMIVYFSSPKLKVQVSLAAFKIVAVSLAARGAFMIVAASIEAKS